MAKTFVFSVDSSLLGELGERLVTFVHIALTELVKNAYDADARSALVAISYDDSGLPVVEVSDTGSGMTLQEVRSYWMKIGTVNKRREPHSPIFGRPRTGEKGIGRFCCRRLGTRLELKTCALLPESERTKEERYETTDVTFNWLKFEGGTDVSEVKCPGDSRRHATGKTGPTLRITGAPADEWRQRGFDFVRRQLAVLATNRGARRPGYRDDPGFAIKFSAPGFEGGIGDLREQVIDATWGTLTAKVGADGIAHCELSAKGIGRREITSRRTFPHLKGTDLKLGIMPFRKEDFRDPKVLSLDAAAQIAENWGGVQVRFHAFRVYPYGDPGDDWLGIDRDRARRVGRPDADRDGDQLFHFAAQLGRVDPSRVMLGLLSGSNYVGTINVGANARGLEPKADRMGFVASAALNELREFARFAIDWATIWRDFYIETARAGGKEKARQELVNTLGRDVPPDQLANAAVGYLRKQIDHLVTYLPDENERTETRRILHQTTKALQTSVADDQEKLRRLRLIASASTLTLLFAHEIKSLLGTLDVSAHTIRRVSSRAPAKEQERLIGLADEIEDAKARFKDLIELTALVGAMGKQVEAPELNLREHINRAVKCFALIAKDYSLSISAKDVPPDILVGPLLPGELYAVLLNVLSNAIKSVIAAGSPRRIAFRAVRNGRRVEVDIQDTGVGLAEEQFEAVFATFISDPEGLLYDGLEEHLNPQDRLMFGEGTGLGLSIVRDILRSRGGDVVFRQPDEGWKASVRMTFP